MEWEDWFQSKILDRGYDYFERDLVKNFKIRGNKITAQVDGTKSYNVEITLKNDSIVDAYCDCPYADEGNYCKHMAAVLYYFDESETSNDEDIEGLIDSASYQQVHDFLLDIMSRNQSILNSFKEMIDNKDSTVRNDYCGLIDTIIDTYSDVDGYINYYAATDFGARMYGFIDDDIRKLVDDGQLDEAWKTISYLFEQVSQLDIDDSDGERMSIFYQAEDIWDELLNQASKDLKEQMYEWCRQVLYDDSDNLDDFIIDTFVSNFNEKSFLEDKLEFSALKLQQIQNSDETFKDFALNRWAKIHIYVMKELKLSKDEMRKFYLNNLNSNQVRFLYADFCVEQKDYATAIEILKQGKDISKKEGYLGVTSKYSEKLKNLYKDTGRNDEYLNELWLLETKYSPADVNIYQELEQQYSHEKWLAKREEIFSRLSDHQAIDKLYLSDKMYDRLMDFVVKSGSIYYVNEYEKDLKSIYPEELFAVYTKIVKGMAENTSDRKYYRKIVRILNRMVAYPDGSKKTSEIVQDMKKEYAKRPAMMDELKKVKI